MARLSRAVIRGKSDVQSLCPRDAVAPGDALLVHAGTALTKLDEAAA